MSSRIFLLLSLVFALLQGSFLPPVFLEGLLVVIFILSSASGGSAFGGNQPTRVLAGLFMSGLLFDVVQAIHLGATSAIFLILGVAMLLLKNDIPISRPWIGAAAGTIVMLARSKFVFGNIDVWAVVAGIVITFFVLSFARLSKSEKLEI